MIDVKCPEYFEDVRRWAAENGLEERFQEIIDYLDGYGGERETRCLVFTDFAPQSFQVTMQRLDDNDVWRDWWHGGCIYRDGEWSVHT